LKLAITADLGGHVGLAISRRFLSLLLGGYKRVGGELVRFPTPQLTATVFISKLHLAGRYATNVS